MQIRLTWAYSYQQAELMSIYYKQPILLIEFDQKKSFSLEVILPSILN